MTERETNGANQPQEVDPESREGGRTSSSRGNRIAEPESVPRNRLIDMLTGRARRAGPRQTRTYRLASSVRLPWIVGFLLFLLIALAAALLIGRTEGEVQVPQVVLDNQEAGAQSAAQSVRRSVNEGVEDLEAFSSTVRPFSSNGTDQDDSLEEALTGAAEIHNRYLALYVVDDQGEILVNAAEEDEEPVFDPLEIVEPFQGAGMGYAWQAEGTSVPVILQYAPLPQQDGQDGAVIGWYDPAFFRFPLSAAGPGDTWLVNSDGQVIGSTGGFTAFQNLPREPLREAASRAAAGQSGASVEAAGLDTQEVVAFAPVAGAGPAGSLEWSVVTARSVNSISLPETDARRQALTIAAVVALASIVIFGWLWVLVFRPLFRLQREAERLAYGDLSRSVEVIRYDEIGLIARALERIRVLLVRRRVQGDRPLRKSESTEKES